MSGGGGGPKIVHLLLFSKLYIMEMTKIAPMEIQSSPDTSSVEFVTSLIC